MVCPLKNTKEYKALIEHFKDENIAYNIWYEFNKDMLRDSEQRGYLIADPIIPTVKEADAFYNKDYSTNSQTPEDIRRNANRADSARIASYDKLVKLLAIRIDALKKLKGTDASKRKELNQRIKIIRAQIEKLRTNISYDTIFSVMHSNLDQIEKYLKNPSTEDLNEILHMLKSLSTVQETISDIDLVGEQLSNISSIRRMILYNERIALEKLYKKVSAIAQGYGLQYTPEELKKAYVDISSGTANFLSASDTDLPELKIASLLLDKMKFKVSEEVLRKQKEANKHKSTLSTQAKMLFDDKGRFITEVSPDYFDEEREVLKEFQEAKKEIFAEKERTNADFADTEKLKEIFYKLIEWYLQNNEYELTQELFQKFNEDYALQQEVNGNSEEGLKLTEKWYNENNPQGGLEMYKTYKKTGVIEFTPGNSKWYKYLKPTPKEKWKNPLYENVKDNPLRQFIENTLIEAFQAIPHKEILDYTSYDKMLKDFILDTTKDDLTLRSIFSKMKDIGSDLFLATITEDDIEGINRDRLDQEGREIKQVRHVNIKDINTKNPEHILDSVMKFYSFAQMYKFKTEALPILELLTTGLETKKVIPTNILGNPEKNKDGQFIEITPGADFESNALKLLKFNILSKIYDESRLDEDTASLSKTQKEEFIKALLKWQEEDKVAMEAGLPRPPKPTAKAFSWVKASDFLVDYTRLASLSLKPFTSISNLIIGINSNFIHAARGTDFTDKQLFKALGLLTNNMLKYFTGNKIVTKDAKKIMLLAEKFGALENIHEDQSLGSKFVRFMYTMQTSGEFVIHVSGLLAKMYNTKIVDKTGKERNLYEAFTVKDDALHWNTSEFNKNALWDKIDITDEKGKNISELFKFQRQYLNFRKLSQGNYMDAMMYKGDWKGRILMLFRTWLPQAVNQRFGKERKEGEYDLAFKGRYLTYADLYNSYKGNFFKKTFIAASVTGLGIIPGLNNIFEKVLKGQKLSDVDIQNMRANVRELQILLGFVLLALMLKGLDDDDDIPMSKFMINLAQRAYQDLGFFYSPSNAQNILRDIIPIMKTVNDAYDVFDKGTSFIISPSSDTYKRGIRKGHSKLVKETMELFPITQSIQNTISSISQVYGTKSYKFK